MENKIINIISSVTSIPEDELKKNTDDENLWDSIQKVEIVLGIEEEFDIMFEQEEIANMTNIANICKITGEKL